MRCSVRNLVVTLTVASLTSLAFSSPAGALLARAPGLSEFPHSDEFGVAGEADGASDLVIVLIFVGIIVLLAIIADRKK